MNFLTLKDQLVTVLFENNDIIAVDKPYGVNSHTNEAKQGNENFIQDGLIETYERQLGIKLHIIHRLDQTTTGVIVFGKSVESTKKYANFFFERQVKKTYLFITAEKSPKDQYTIDKMIIHKGQDLEAQTHFQRLKKSAHFELWQAEPHTGRNHQIRIHAQAAGISLLGDQKYGGKEYPFLCLHNQRIEFPNQIVIESTAAPYFENLELLQNQIIAKAFFETDRRKRLFAKADSNQCFRLAHNKNDFKELGFAIDQFGPVLVLYCYDIQWLQSQSQTLKEYSAWMKRPILVRFMSSMKQVQNKIETVIFPMGEAALELPNRWTAQENKIVFQLRSDVGQSFGLFLDQRLQRHWVFENSTGKSVLNLFSYTCGFSVAAALGKASEVVSVDTSKAVLSWGKDNFELNSILSQNYKFLCRDSLAYLEQCLNKNIKFDLIICDPPSFSRGEKGVFKIETSLEILIKNCLRCLTENGQLLFSTNFEGFTRDDIRRAILKVQGELGLKNLCINCLQSAFDCELVGQSPILKSFLIQLS